MKETLQDDAGRLDETTLEVSLWSRRDWWVVLPAKSLAAAGQGLVSVALALRVHDSGSGPWAMTALLMCLALPTIATMGVAGHVADTRDSRRMLVATHVVQALAVLGLALLEGLAATYAMVLVFATAAAFGNPVWSALTPRIVGLDNIGQAVAWQQGLAAALTPGGAALGGVLYGMYGAQVPLLAGSALMLSLVVAAAVVRTRRGGRRDARLADIASSPGLRAGLSVIRSDQLLAPLMAALFALVLVVEGVNVLEVFLCRDVLNATPAEYGFSEVAFGVGAVGGSVVAGLMRTARARALSAISSFGCLALLIVASGLAPSFWVYLALAVPLGVGNAVGNGVFGALVMTRVADHNRGKVMSTLGGTLRVASVSALALGGLAGSVLGPRPTFVAGGVLGAVAAAWGLVRVVRALRTEDMLRPEAQAALATAG